MNIDRFYRAFDKSDDGSCWIWKKGTHGKAPNNYGSFFMGREGRPRMAKAHRVMWELRYGEIPQGMCVCHHCDNPRCVNPDHLFLGTNADNMLDMRNKGRSIKGRPQPHNRGCGNGMCSFTPEQITEIRLKRAAGFRLQDIADEFDCGIATVSRIANKVTHLE